MNISDARRLAREEMNKHGLEHIPLVFNSRLTRAFGRYRWNTVSGHRCIELSTKLVEINEWERVRKTVLHEIAHALTEGHGHDMVWRNKLLDIGGDGKRCYSSSDTVVLETRRSTKLYTLECSKCEYRGGRYRRKMNGYMHRRCGGEMFNVELT